MAKVLQSSLKMRTSRMRLPGPSPNERISSLLTNLDRTVNGILARSGQVCMAPSRVYVQESIAKTFTDAYISKMKEAVANIGDPQEPSVSMGPLVDNRAFDRVKGLVARGTSDATLAVGGKPYGDKGCYFEPTVFLNPQPDAEILKEEIFGPVAILITFKTEEEVLELANDTEFGLMSGVFTRDLNRALRVSAMLESGVVGVNCVSYVSHFPKESKSEIRNTEKRHLPTIDQSSSSVRWQESVWDWTRVGGIRKFFNSLPRNMPLPNSIGTSGPPRFHRAQDNSHQVSRATVKIGHAN